MEAIVSVQTVRKNMFARGVLFFLLMAGGFFAQVNSGAVFERTQFFGKDFVRMTDWARSSKLELQWITKGRELRATNANHRIYFSMDGRRIQVNGVNLLLSLPVLFQRNTAYISSVDAQMTLQPILFPEKSKEDNSVTTICLDPGHGGKDPGKTDGKMQEKSCSLLLAADIEKLLKQAGLKVIRTRARDLFVDLPERARLANQRKADLFLSLHYNAAANRRVEGAEVFCLTPAGTASSENDDWKKASSPTYPGNSQNQGNILLAYQMQKSLVKKLNVEDRGIKRAQFVVLLDGKMPSILIEGGFMTNPNDAKRIYDPAYRKRMAGAIVDGILAYKKSVEKPAPTVSSN